jgi:chromosomal replication initiator protein
MTDQGEAVRIIQTSAAHFDVPVRQLLGPRRDGPIVACRHVAMYLCRRRTELSYPEIGDLFGRHHTSVLYADQRIAGILAGTTRAAAGIAGHIATITSALKAASP